MYSNVKTDEFFYKCFILLAMICQQSGTNQQSIVITHENQASVNDI